MLKSLFVIRSLRTKLSILFIGIAFVPLVFVMVVVIVRVLDQQRENVIIHDRHTAQIAAEQIEAFIISQFTTLRNVGVAYPQLVHDGIVEDALVEQFLHKGGEFSELAIVDKTGHEFVRKHTLRVVAPENLQDRSQTLEFFEVQRNGHYLGSQYLRDGKPFFLIGEEIVAPDGSFEGAVFAEVDARVLQDVVKNIQHNGEGRNRAYIVNAAGIVIAHANISQVLLEQDFSVFPAVQRMIYSDDIQVNPLASYVNETGEVVLGAGFPITVRLSETPFDPVLEPGWFVVVEQPASIGLASVRQLTQFGIVAVSGVFIVAIVVGVLFARSLSNPIRELQRGAREIGLGNLEYAFDVRTNDEIQDLASELNKMRFRLKEIRDREENLLRVKSEFVTIAAHQLRTPLSGIKWALSLLKESASNFQKNQQELVKKMVQSNNRMILLVNDLLDAARIEEGRFAYKKTPSSIQEIVESTIEKVRERSVGKSVQIVFHKQQAPLPLVRIDQDAIKLVFENLLNNALNYTLQDGKIAVSVEQVKQNVFVSVADTGIGIPEEEQDRVFTKFFRGAAALKLETEGSGLGLFIAKNIVEAHNGRIWFESNEKEGTTFSFTIPI